MSDINLTVGKQTAENTRACTRCIDQPATHTLRLHLDGPAKSNDTLLNLSVNLCEQCAKETREFMFRRLSRQEKGKTYKRRVPRKKLKIK